MANTLQHTRTRYPGLVNPNLVTSYIPSDDLVCWYQANKEIGYSDGGAITQITDWSGNGYHMTGTGTYVVSGATKLIDSDDFQNTTRPATGNSPISFAVFGDTYNNGGTLFGVGGANDTKRSMNICSDQLFCWGYDPTFTSMGTSAPWYLITVVYDGTDIKIYKDTTLHTTLSQGSFNITGGAYMFRWFWNDRQSTLRMRFAGVWNKALTTTEITNLSSFVIGNC
jgi:hypothetical protein